MFYLLAVGGIAAVVSYPVTNFVGLMARRWGFVDRPDGHHKGHDREVALGGGLAVFLAAAVTFLVEYIFSDPLQGIFSEAHYLGGLLLAGSWIVCLGLYDDRFGMRGRYKLVGQIVAAIIVISAGLKIESIVIFDHRIHLDPFTEVFTVFWLVGAMNSLNLLDGIDGLATTIGIILCATITIMALIFGQAAVAVVGAVFTGSLLGFLRFNYPPAKIFLGDAGSMLIGLVVGTLAIGGSFKGPATVAMAAPLAIWALPIFDSLAAIMRRKLTGRSIYATDRGHLHHRLMSMFGKNSRVLAVVAVCCAVTCAGALLSSFMNNDWAAIISVVAVLLILVATQAFGHVEFLMIIARFKSLLLRTFGKNIPREYSFRLQGSRDWNMMWQSITEFAEKLDLVEIKIDLNLAAMQEGFHATWRQPSVIEKQERWSTDFPLFAENHLIGRVWISGERSAGKTSCEAIQQFMELFEPLESEIISLATNRESQQTASPPEPVPPSGTASELSVG